MADPTPNSKMWTKTNVITFLEVSFCLTILCLSWVCFLPFQIFWLYILVSTFYLFGFSVSEYMWLSTSMGFLYFVIDYLFCLIILHCYSLFYFILLWLLDACMYYNVKEKERMWTFVCGQLGRAMDELVDGKHNQNMW